MVKYVSSSPASQMATAVGARTYTTREFSERFFPRVPRHARVLSEGSFLSERSLGCFNFSPAIHTSHPDRRERQYHIVPIELTADTEAVLPMPHPSTRTSLKPIQALVSVLENQ